MTDAAGWTIRREDAPDPGIRAGILAPLLADDAARVGPAGADLLAMTVRDAGGAVVGGLWGRIAYGFLFIGLLGPAKGLGLGRTLMGMAEDEAARRGLSGIWLDTVTFQAPGFYRGLGCAGCGRITGYPPGHDRVFLVKYLTGPAAGGTAPTGP